MASAGDTNADGFNDVIIGAMTSDDGGITLDGKAFVYLGSPSGLENSPAWTATAATDDQSYFGWSVAGAGDVNGDGFDDVLVGAYGEVVGQWVVGRAYAYLGSASGPGNEPVWIVEGSSHGEGVGNSVAGAGDVNADGYDDVIVGAFGAGRADVYLGSAAGLAIDPVWTAPEQQTSSSLGDAVASAGDVDGDGYDDAMIGAPSYDSEVNLLGAALVYRGDGCGTVEFCPANPNSTGGSAAISASGSIAAASGSLVLQAGPVPDQLGLFFHGADESGLPFGNGFLCATGSLARGQPTQAVNHLAAYAYDNSNFSHDLGPFAGSKRHFQYWFRDPQGGGALFNTSNAISIRIHP